MKRHVATIRVEVDAQSTAARDDVLNRLCGHINEKPPTVYDTYSGRGSVRGNVKVSRVRPARARRKK